MDLMQGQASGGYHRHLPLLVIYRGDMNRVMREHKFPLGQILRVVHGDITEENVDAIVNAANEHLAHGGGVAGLIVSRGGLEIQAESTAWVRKNGPVSHDRPAYTYAGRLPFRYIIHAVGPVWGSGQEDTKLAAAITGSLRLAEQLNLPSLAFPAISTGIFGFPKDRAAKIIFDAIQNYFTGRPESSLKRVHVTLYDQTTLDVFLKNWPWK